MRRTGIFLIFLALVVAACGGTNDADPVYDIHSRLTTDHRAVLELLIGNEGTEPLEPTDDYEARFLIRSEDGPARASASVSSFPTVAPGDTRTVFTWSAELNPGIYSVVWGDDGRAVGATVHIDDTSFGMSGPDATTVPGPIVPTTIAPLVVQAMHDVETRGDPGQARVSAVQMGIPESDTLVIEITTTSDSARRVYRYHRTPDGLELATLEETPPH